MQAKHPLTGKPIRILRTETHLYRDDKTLCWLRDQPYLPKFGRWDSLVSDANALETWTRVLGMPPMVFASVSNDSAEIKKLLESDLLNGVQIIFLRKGPLMAYGKPALEAKGYQNIICIEEIERMYPNTFYKFYEDSEQSLPDLILAIGAMFKHHRIVGFYDYECSADYKTLLNTTYNITTGLSTEQPRELWLIQQWFQPSKLKRERELKKCLQKNIENPYIDKILLLNEDEYPMLPKHEKLQIKRIDHRLRYWDVMEAIQTQCPPDTLIAFANLDIYFDETVRQLWSVRMEDRFLSLLRWDEQEDPTKEPILFGPRPDSQDSWIVLSTSLQQRTLVETDFDFEFGRAGCDNAINLSMLKNKFVVCNPAYSLKTVHVHQSGLRTYNPKDCIDKPMYLYVEPTGLHDMSPQKDLKAYERPWQQATPFSRPIKGDRQQVRTLCTMLAREEVFYYDPDEENRWVPTNKEKDTVYELKNCITTTNGLNYDFNKIYLGNYEAYIKEWSTYELSQLVPCLSVSSVATTLCPDEVVKNPFTFITQYLAKILTMRDQGYKGEFWVPRDGFSTKILREFQWDEEQIPILPRDKNIQVFGKTTYVLPPVKTPGSTAESIAVLRKTLRAYRSFPDSTKIAILFQEDDILDIQATTILEKMLQGLGYTTHVLYPKTAEFSHTIAHMCGAQLLIAPLTKLTQSHHLYWLLPKGAQVIELQKELEPLGEGVHEAGAASLDYWFASVPRGKNLHTLIAERIYNIFSMQLSSSNQNSAKPVLTIPSQPQEGIHAHTGDSFREIARLWEKKGYVTLKTSQDTPFCWLNDTLLYDRPTYKWLEDANPTFKHALVGNPAPRSASMKPWSFWPRHPELVEGFVAEGLQQQNQTRSKKIVFYGKCENATQIQRRSGQDWSTACEEWQMATPGEPYALSQEEYLKKLAEAKFGLCLPGFGFKCHREIECMALGTVPLCAPEVDMTNYANPPVEGVHYFRVNSPSEARAIADTTTNQEWNAMSKACQQWWRENASVDGLWELTKKLVLE
jgi:hypothetical protein